MKKLLLAATILACVPFSVQAETKRIKHPSIEQGWEVDNSGHFAWDDDLDSAWVNKTDLEYGINNHFRVGITGTIQKIEGDSLDYAETELEAAWRFTGDESSLQAAVQGEYAFNHEGGPDELGVTLLLAGSAYGLDHVANIGVSHEVGDDADGGIGADFSWGSYYDMGTWDIGGEYYADFGNLSDNNSWSEQEHHLGPVVGFSVPISEQRVIDARVGYLLGLSKASHDSVLKYEMRTGF
jgi:hypothetical protein